MFIQTEETPNPQVLKFLPGQAVTGGGMLDCPSKEDAAQLSPLALVLFSIDGVAGVFLGTDFISVTIQEGEEWYLLKPAILGAIMEHYVTGQPVLMDDADKINEQNQDPEPQFDEKDQPIVDQIKELLESRIRPHVQMDGGDITFHGFDKGIVYLTMRGACAGCPSSTATLKMGIENMLRHYIPEVSEVRAT